MISTIIFLFQVIMHTLLLSWTLILSHFFFYAAPQTEIPYCMRLYIEAQSIFKVHLFTKSCSLYNIAPYSVNC